MCEHLMKAFRRIEERIQKEVAEFNEAGAWFQTLTEEQKDVITKDGGDILFAYRCYCNPMNGGLRAILGECEPNSFMRSPKKT